MLGSVNLFVWTGPLTPRRALHSSVMTNLMEFTVHRTNGDRLLCQQLLGCCVVRSIRAIQAFRAHMSALPAYGNQCCSGAGCVACLNSFADYKDTWTDCRWTDGFGTTYHRGTKRADSQKLFCESSPVSLEGKFGLGTMTTLSNRLSPDFCQEP